MILRYGTITKRKIDHASYGLKQNTQNIHWPWNWDTTERDNNLETETSGGWSLAE